MKSSISEFSEEVVNMDDEDGLDKMYVDLSKSDEYYIFQDEKKGIGKKIKKARFKILKVLLCTTICYLYYDIIYYGVLYLYRLILQYLL